MRFISPGRADSGPAGSQTAAELPRGRLVGWGGKRRAILTLLHGFTPVRLAQGSRHRFTSRRRASARGVDWGISPEAPPSYGGGPLEGR